MKKHIQNEYIRNALIRQNWKDIRISDIPKLYAIVSKRLIRTNLYGKNKRRYQDE